MFRVLRQPGDAGGMAAAPDGTTLAQVPVRVRATSNPGGRHAGWVKTRFVDPATRRPEAILLRSRLEDNPSSTATPTCRHSASSLSHCGGG
jgi:hypothetical protein